MGDTPRVDAAAWSNSGMDGDAVDGDVAREIERELRTAIKANYRELLKKYMVIVRAAAYSTTHAPQSIEDVPRIWADEPVVKLSAEEHAELRLIESELPPRR